MRACMVILAIGVLTVGCATTATTGPRSRAHSRSSSEKQVTLRQEGMSTLADVARRLGPQVGGVVLMHGIEDRFVEPFDYTGANSREVVEDLARKAGCSVQFAPNYAFVYPPGYEMLLGLSFDGRLGPPYASSEAGVAFGVGTPVFRVCAVLSQALGMTIVADNIIGGALCGELALTQAPLGAALDAVLKSARIVPTAFRVDTAPEYLLIHTAENVHPPDLALNEAALSAEQTARLERLASVVLPYPQADSPTIHIPDYAMRLRDVLPALSSQLGMPVEADSALDELPVNPMVLQHVRVRTAVDLLIRQWPVPEFGYEVTERGIRISRRVAKAALPAAPNTEEQRTSAATTTEAGTGTPAPHSQDKGAKTHVTPKKSTSTAPEQPAPAPEQPAPVPEQPAPAPEQPAVVPEQPAPAPEEPAPAPEQPAVVLEQPAPAPEQTASQPEQPAATPEQPAPAPEQPAPAPEQPAPVPEQTAPAPAPEQSAPAPAPEQPAPAPDQPAPAPEQSAPAPEQPAPAPEQSAPAPEQSAPAPEQPAPAPEQPGK